MTIIVTGPSLSSPLTLNNGPYDTVAMVMANISAIIKVPVSQITLYYGGLVADPPQALTALTQTASVGPPVSQAASITSLSNYNYSFVLSIAATPPKTLLYAYPRTVSNVTVLNTVTNKNSIDWVIPSQISQNNYAFTKMPIRTMSGFWQEKFLGNTSQLWLTNYNIPSLIGTTVLGIELKLNVLRNARIQDLVVQLTLQGNLIGNNYANLINPVQADMYTADFSNPLNPAQDLTIYGGPSDTWGANLSIANVSDPTFGVVVSFQSNSIIPHVDTVYLDQADIRVTYV